PVEEVLVEMWGQLLDVDPVGIHDNFIELGGHSLLATRLLLQVNQAFQVEIPLSDLFQAPTVAGLAARLLAHETAPGKIQAVARLRRQIDTFSTGEIQAMLESKASSQQ